MITIVYIIKGEEMKEWQDVTIDTLSECLSINTVIEAQYLRTRNNTVKGYWVPSGYGVKAMVGYIRDNTKRFRFRIIEETQPKPPIGLRPQNIVQELRYKEITEAIFRYTQAGKCIPVEWTKEHKELVKTLGKENSINTTEERSKSLLFLLNVGVGTPQGINLSKSQCEGGSEVIRQLLADRQCKGDKMKSIWVYDDLWEEGYRFDDILNNRHVMIAREFAKDEYEAISYLGTEYKSIKKNKGTGICIRNSVYSNALFLFI
jgi:hypothetical protein